VSSVSRSDATVETLLGLVPGVDELEVLRLQLMAAATPDPEKAWESSSASMTIDKRILTAGDVDRALDRARQAVLDYVTFLHEGLRPVFRAFFAGDMDAASRHLVALGDRHEAAGRAIGARQCFATALQLSLPLTDKGPQILALRRLGRVALSLGEVQDASAFYQRSAELARDSGDVRGDIIARTGSGNVSMYQGRWAEAVEAYAEALALAEQPHLEEMTLERGQLFNNLGNVYTRWGRLNEAEEWLSKAGALAATLESPPDLGIWYLNLGHLREAQGRIADARNAYEAGVALPISPSLKALIAADLADVCLLDGFVSEAEEMARVAEEHAIASGSPYTIGYMYRSLGNLARARGDEDGFTFFEKALQIAREKGYPSLEAETLADYAELRRKAGGGEEAEAYLERARELFIELGSPQNVANAEEALAEIRAQRTALEDTPETPLAAAGD
jgi:tetratricopeptide (TPR) repeat protein